MKHKTFEGCTNQAKRLFKDLKSLCVFWILGIVIKLCYIFSFLIKSNEGDKWLSVTKSLVIVHNNIVSLK